MIIKRIRQTALRKKRALSQLAAVVRALTTYAIDAEPALIEAIEREGRAANYILDVEKLGVEPGEKVEFHGTRKLIGDSLVQHQQQMLAACLLAPAARDPIEHYVISWRKGEMPRLDQIEEVVSIFSEEMGYQQSPLVWSVHSNTAQRHLHVVACRIDLANGSVVSPGERWEIDRLHQVIALIEDRQGWSSEKNSIYISKAGVVYDRATMQVVRRADGSRDGCYKRKFDKPAIGQAPEHHKVVAALQEATSWRDLHYRLGLEHAAYVKKGSGAEILIRDHAVTESVSSADNTLGEGTASPSQHAVDLTVRTNNPIIRGVGWRKNVSWLGGGFLLPMDEAEPDQEPAVPTWKGLDQDSYEPDPSADEVETVLSRRIKASHFGEEFSFMRMSERLGPFEPDVTKERDPHELYRIALSEERARLREALNNILDQLRRRRMVSLKYARLRERDQFLRAIAEERIQLAYDQIDSGVKGEFDVARRKIAESFLSRSRWYLADKPSAVAVELPNIILLEGDLLGRNGPDEHDRVIQDNSLGTTYPDRAGERAYTDYGVVQIVHQVGIREVEAVLTLASTRSGSMRVSGAPAFLDACRVTSKRRGFNIVDEDGRSLHPPAGFRVARGPESMRAADTSRAVTASGPTRSKVEAQLSRVPNRTQEATTPADDDYSADLAAYLLKQGKGRE